jgi:molybdopterin-guanine dinucleotide biosynthesis protein A
MTTAAPVAGLLLTGGASRRLGVDKATLLLDGETLARRAARVLSAACRLVFEVGPGVTDLPTVDEGKRHQGPLVAIAAGGDALRARGHGGSAIVLAVDLPRIETRLLELLRDWPGAPTVVPEVDGRLQTACARYGGDALLAARSLVDGGARRLHDVLDVVDVDRIGADVWGSVATPSTFADVDTMADAARLGVHLPG